MAIVYFDSSALVKLVVAEDGSEIAAKLWDGADGVVSSGLAYPEVRAALAAAQRDGRMSRRAHARAKADWETFWADLGLVEPRRALLEATGDIAERHELRGYDAVHLASALAIPAGAVVMAVWDTRLGAAAAEAGLSVAPLPG